MPLSTPNDPIKVTTLDGWSDFTLLEPFYGTLRDGRQFMVRAGCQTDGLSGPKFDKCDLQNDRTFLPAVVHDACYRGWINIMVDGKYVPFYPTKEESDSILKQLLEDNKVAWAECEVIYAALELFGGKAWNEDAPLRFKNKPI